MSPSPPSSPPLSLASLPLAPLTDAEVEALSRTAYFVRDGVFGTSVATSIAREAMALCEGRPLRTPGMGRQALQAYALRNDAIAWVEPDDSGPALRALHGWFTALAAEVNRSVYLGLGRFDVQLARYAGEGARYTRHRDAFSGPGQAGPNRRLTAIWYANAEWHEAHGGLLRLYPEGMEPVDVAPVLDRLVVFLSDRLEHEVLPAYAPRVALTAWYYGGAYSVIG